MSPRLDHCLVSRSTAAQGSYPAGHPEGTLQLDPGSPADRWCNQWLLAMCLLCRLGIKAAPRAAYISPFGKLGRGERSCDGKEQRKSHAVCPNA